MSSYDFWIHGINVQCEKNIPGMEVKREPTGTLVRQPAGTNNCFNIAIPTPTVIDNTGGDLRHGWVEVALGESAKIELIEAWDGEKRIHTDNRKWVDGNYRIEIDLPDQKANYGILFRICVSFLPGSWPQVRFHSVGIRFDK